MNIKGQYRDVIIRHGKVLQDRGWKSNTIVPDYGRFLAALMKKYFQQPVGIEYILVGSSSIDFAAFKKKATDYFNWLNEGNSGPYVIESYWIWAKPIEPANVKFLDEKDVGAAQVTHRLMIDVAMQKDEPGKDTFNFREFGLVGIDKDKGAFITDRLYFINYVAHGQITKDSSMELSRTIKLEFPIN